MRSVREGEAAAAEAVVSVRKSIQSLTNLGLPISFAGVRDTPPEELRERIQMLGLPRNITQHLEPGKTSSNLIPVLSPRDGTIVTREVVEGEAVDNSRALFVIADTSQMWVLLNVSLEDAEHVQLGQELKFEPDGTNRVHTGKLTWISTDVDRTTRTIEVRGQLDNADRQLRNETFGVGSIVLREENNATLVPRSAVHWEGCCHVVFVRDRNFMKKGAFKVFHTRSVRPGVTQSDTTEIIAGLYPDEIVVTSGSGVLRAELLKGELGAG